jgi:hypothetical protein
MSARRIALLRWGLLIGSTMMLTLGSLSELIDGIQIEDLLIFILLVCLGVGSLITFRRPENPIGWLFLSGTLVLGLQSLLIWYAHIGLEVRPGSLPAVDLAGALTNGLGNIGFGLLFSFTFVLFPDGRLLSPRWRPVVWLGLIGLVWQVLETFRPGSLFFYEGWENPLGIKQLAAFYETGTSVNEILTTFPVLAGPLCLFLRYRRASPTERQQIKLVTYVAGVVMGITGVMLVASSVIHIDEIWLNLVFLLLVMSIPLSIGAAILRYRLWDIEVIIRRTLVYTVLTVLLALVYFGMVIVLEGALRAVIGGSSQVATVVSTLTIAALFTPLRRRVQASIDRRFYRWKYNAEQALASFSAAARSETDLEALTDELVRVVEETMRPASVSLWLRGK